MGSSLERALDYGIDIERSPNGDPTRPVASVRIPSRLTIRRPAP